MEPAVDLPVKPMVVEPVTESLLGPSSEESDQPSLVSEGQVTESAESNQQGKDRHVSKLAEAVQARSASEALEAPRHSSASDQKGGTGLRWVAVFVAAAAAVKEIALAAGSIL